MSPVFAASGTQTFTPTVHGMVQGTVEKVPELDAKNFGGTKFDVSKVRLVLTNTSFLMVTLVKKEANMDMIFSTW